jgi:hypothetical protein
MSEEQSTTPAESKVTLTVEQRAELLARVDSAKVSTRDAVIEAARVTFAVVSSSLIGKHDGAEWETQGDYARDGLGVSPGLVSGLLALGTAMDRGLTPEHPNFDVVYAQRQSIGKAAKEDRKGFGHIVKAAKVAAKPKPRAVSPASESDTPATDTDTYTVVVDALDAIRDMLGHLTADQSRAVSSSLVTLAQAATDRAKVAAAEEKAAKAAA